MPPIDSNGAVRELQGVSHGVVCVKRVETEIVDVVRKENGGLAGIVSHPGKAVDGEGATRVGVGLGVLAALRTDVRERDAVDEDCGRFVLDVEDLVVSPETAEPIVSVPILSVVGGLADGQTPGVVGVAVVQIVPVE